MATQHQSERTVSWTISQHAWMRMGARGISHSDLERVIRFGRIKYVRGARIYAFGKKESGRLCNQGLRFEGLIGLQVVCTPENHVLTVYRNGDFSKLRPKRKRARKRGVKAA